MFRWAKCDRILKSRRTKFTFRSAAIVLRTVDSGVCLSQDDRCPDRLPHLQLMSVLGILRFPHTVMRLMGSLLWIVHRAVATESFALILADRLKRQPDFFPNSFLPLSRLQLASRARSTGSKMGESCAIRDFDRLFCTVGRICSCSPWCCHLPFIFKAFLRCISIDIGKGLHSSISSGFYLTDSDPEFKNIKLTLEIRIPPSVT